MCSSQLSLRARVELAPLVAVGLVRDRRAEHPERNLLAVDLDLELGLELGELLGVLARQVAEVPLAGETPELAHSCAAVDRDADRLRLLELGQVRVALVDRRRGRSVSFRPGEVEVVLLVELGDEAVRLLAVGVELPVGGRGRAASVA